MKKYGNLIEMKNKINIINMVMVKFYKLLIVAICFSSFFIGFSFASAEDKPFRDYNVIIKSHPRIFINQSNIADIQTKTNGIFHDLYQLMTRRTNHKRIPGKMKNIRDYIYKHAFLYQVTGDKKWADYALTAVDKIPQWLEAYGGSNGGYGLAVEALSIGFDWCHDLLSLERKRDIIKLINKYIPRCYEDLKRLPDFHNYASYSEFAILAAGLSTFGENAMAKEYIDLATDIMEDGYIYKKNKVYYNVKDAIDFVDGTCNWEGATYARHQIFSAIKYCKAWQSATNGKVDLFKGEFSNLENAGYYILYSVRPDGKYANISDVAYPQVSYYDINNLSGLQSAFGNGYFTTFIDDYYSFDSGSFKTNCWLGSVKSSLVFYVLWYDNNIEPKELVGLPQTKRFGDVIIMRTGFNENDTFITFKSGTHYGFHSQLDHGSFTIFKNAPLTIDSGYNDSWRRGKLHNWSYWKRSIAHNTLLIYDEKEKWPDHPRGNKCLNDGGQRMVFRTFSPPYSRMATTFNPRSIAEIKDNWENFNMGEIKVFEAKDEYDYIKTDLTNAYNNRYSEKGNNQPKKVNLVERNFLYLRPDIIFVFDKVNSVKSNFKKKWLIHSGSFYDKLKKPKLDGEFTLVKGNQNYGIIKSKNSSLLEIDNGEVKLFVKTLLPKKHITKRIGGKGYEFWVDSKNCKISQEIPKQRQAEDPGAWRIEVEPEQSRRNNIFLNVLYIAEKGKDITVKNIDKISSGFIGAYVKKADNNYYAVLFNDCNSLTGKLEYEIGNKDCKHFIFNLIPNRYYNVYQEKTAKGYMIKVSIGKKAEGRLSSKNGTLSFMTKVK